MKSRFKEKHFQEDFNRESWSDVNMCLNAFSLSLQKFHEFYIRETHPEIKVIRKNLTEIHVQAKLGPKNELIM